MSTQSPETADTTEMRGRSGTDRLTRPKRLLSVVRRRGGNGTTASLAGGTLLAAAVRTAGRNRRRAGMLAVVGAALLGTGIRRRRSDGGTSTPDEREPSAEASANQTASDLVGPSEQATPRGVSGESDVETDPDGGTIQFTTGHEETGEPKPHLDPADPKDPRYADEDDPETAEDTVEVSLSETKMTDELGKVAGPDEEQAYPASEGTDPEPMSDRAPPRYGEGAVANKGQKADEREAGDDIGNTEISDDGETTGAESAVDDEEEANEDVS